MADTFDDEIIDLTDLMEEGEPGQKQTETRLKDKSKGPEPESFDLGKEISLDDALIGEELELDTKSAAGGAPERGKAAAPAPDIFEAEAASASSKAASSADFDALIQGATVEVTGEEVVLEEPFTPEERRTVQEKPAKKTISSDFDSFFKEAVQESKAEIEVIEEAGEIPPEEEIVMEQPLRTESVPVRETPAEAPAFEVPEPPLATPPMAPRVEADLNVREEMEAGLQAAAEALKADIPAMLEGIVRPVMGELVRELITATRDLLPGIVEKIIREEIEKLKKLD